MWWLGQVLFGVSPASPKQIRCVHRRININAFNIIHTSKYVQIDIMNIT